MSDIPETPAPQLLSAERLAEIEAQLNVPRARNSYVTDYGVAADVVEELYDHVAAFCQQVATELAGLLVKRVPFTACFSPVAQERQRVNEAYNREIKDLATRLGIELPA